MIWKWNQHVKLRGTKSVTGQMLQAKTGVEYNVWNWVSTGFSRTLMKEPWEHQWPNDADQTLLEFPPTSLAHGPWNPILTQAEPPVPTQATLQGCLFLSTSHLSPLDSYCSPGPVSSFVCSPASCCFWWSPLDGVVDAPFPAPVAALLSSGAAGLAPGQWGHCLGRNPSAPGSLFLRILSLLLHDNPRQDNFFFLS